MPDALNQAVDTQPVGVFVGGLVAFVDAGILAGNALGWLDLTTEQAAALVSFVTIAGGFVVATLRQYVWCRQTVRAAGIEGA